MPCPLSRLIILACQRRCHQNPTRSPQRGSGSRYSTSTAGRVRQCTPSYGRQSSKSQPTRRCKGSDLSEHHSPPPLRPVAVAADEHSPSHGAAWTRRCRAVSRSTSPVLRDMGYSNLLAVRLQRLSCPYHPAGTATRHAHTGYLGETRPPPRWSWTSTLGLRPDSPCSPAAPPAVPVWHPPELCRASCQSDRDAIQRWCAPRNRRTERGHHFAGSTSRSAQLFVSAIASSNECVSRHALSKCYRVSCYVPNWSPFALLFLLTFRHACMEEPTLLCRAYVQNSSKQ